ncbi:hypothetical protein AB0E27_22065 [Streptomyces sparsogenes]|uniref:hypothetical protein n=1 Tax=Streptomyces sparsogenes TaxID=67365 RepID=UPI00340A6092
MAISAGPRTRRAGARGPWLALVLVALIHVMGCAHGPLGGGSWRTDTFTATETTARPPAARAATGQVMERSGACDGHHHEPRTCMGVDEPVLGQPGCVREPLPPPALPAADVAVRPVVPVRGPPEREAVRPCGARRAVLQVWRN